MKIKYTAKEILEKGNNQKQSIETDDYLAELKIVKKSDTMNRFKHIDKKEKYIK